MTGCPETETPKDEDTVVPEGVSDGVDLAGCFSFVLVGWGDVVY